MIHIQSKKARDVCRVLIPAVLFPLTLLTGAVLLREKQYAFTCVLCALLSFVLFLTGFEKKKTGTRRLIIIAIMTALSVAGRFIPLFKPVTALTVITAVYLGGEAGFLTGALSALISNFYFGQGPWTPFQMFAFGLLGLFAGMLHTPLEKSRLALALYGALAGVLYSLFMDVWTVLWYSGTFELRLYLAAVYTALPFTALYAVSNVCFLLLFARPFGRKLKRVKKLYGV